MVRAKISSAQNVEFYTFFNLVWAGARFPRAQSRARLFGARQWILLTKEMLFDYLITIAAQKAAEIGLCEVTTKLDTFAPTCPEYTPENTA